jgi:hypothetical protein
MTAADVVQIVPRLPPPAEGLGGYSLALAAALRSRYGRASRFVVGTPMAPAGATPVADRRAGTLCRLLAEADLPVLLQYAGYGYQNRGCPVWLVDGLARWRRLVPRGRLVTFFHEVHAMGPPWRSSFWLSPVQRRLAARLTRLSDATVTSLDLYAGLLRRWKPRREPAVLPVVSNVGEPETVPPLAERPPRLVVFGGAGNRSKVYSRHLPELAAACRAAAAREIVDIGPAISLPAAVEDVPVVGRGLLPDAEASAALLDARAAFLAYPASFLAKSGAFAAFCAHGLATVCTSEAPPSSGLRAGDHYLPAAWLERPQNLQAVGDAAHAWYAGHALDRHAALLHELLACGS